MATGRIKGAAALLVMMAAMPSASRADAQVVGTFNWQTQPYCNVVTLTIVQQGGMYQLAGADDLCRSGAAPATGTAVVTGGGVALGFTVSLPTGRAAHLSAVVNVANGSGSWSDADGNTGTFFLTAGVGIGAPRPMPTSSAVITTTQLAPTIYAGTGGAVTVARSDHDHDSRYYTKAQSDAADSVLVAKGALGPRGLIAQAEVNQSSATFRYSRASNGQTISVTRPFAGTSIVFLPGFGAPPGATFDQTILVTPSGFNVACSVVSRSNNGSLLTAQVNCFNPSTLVAIDSSFFIMVVS